MYKIVKTEEEHRLFRNIYTEIFEGEKLLIEHSAPNAIQFLFLHGEVAVGTMELFPYNPYTFSTIENEFAFRHHPIVADTNHVIWEIDKVGILKEHRKKGLLEHIFHSLYAFSQMVPVTHLVCLFEHRFYRLVRRMTDANTVMALSDPFIVEGEVSPTVPTILNVQGLIKWYEENMVSSKTSKTLV